jgi:hypothetical protein
LGVFPLPAAVGVLQQTNYSFKAPAQFSYDAPITWALSFKLTPLEVVIDPQDYDSWRPKCETDEITPGNSITIKATLRDVGGTSTDQRAQKFLFELVGVSREPGVALNFPLGPNPGAADLQFTGGNPQLAITGSDRDKAETPPGSYTTASAEVTSFDWGGWGEIKVTAVMPDGSQIPGHLINDDSQTSVRLPKRPVTSHIADVWKQAQGAAGLPDGDDSENDPAGNGTPGDGLTLYEEYRGFYENGEHIEGNPGKKDYFIRDAMNGAISKSGIALFTRQSGLQVHAKLQSNEIASDRTINFNSGAGAHRGAQHAIRIVPVTGSGRGYAQITGRVGPPGLAGTVEVPTEYGVTYKWEDQSTTSYMATTVAHELFHASSVLHHGEFDTGSVTWTPDPSSGAITENGAPVTVLFEDSNQPLSLCDKITVPL